MLGWEDEGVGRGERGEGWEYGVVGGRRLGVRSREKHTEVRGGGGQTRRVGSLTHVDNPVWSWARRKDCLAGDIPSQLRIANTQFELRWHAVCGVLRARAGVELSVSQPRGMEAGGLREKRTGLSGEVNPGLRLGGPDSPGQPGAGDLPGASHTRSAGCRAVGTVLTLFPFRMVFHELVGRREAVRAGPDIGFGFHGQ